MGAAGGGVAQDLVLHHGEVLDDVLLQGVLPVLEFRLQHDMPAVGVDALHVVVLQRPGGEAALLASSQGTFC